MSDVDFFILRNSLSHQPQPTPQPSPSKASRVTQAVGSAAKSVVNGVASTAWDASKWAMKKTFDKALDVTAWVAKGAVIASVATTALTAVGAAISPQITVQVVDRLARTLGATPLSTQAVETMGDVIVIQAQYTGELLALLIKNGVELGAKSVVYTTQAGYTHVIKPLVSGFAGAVVREAGHAWTATKGFFFGS